MGTNQQGSYGSASYTEKICNRFDLVHMPDDGLYVYLPDEGYWRPMHTDYVESVAMKMLGQKATSAKISDIRKLVERKSIIPIGRNFNDHDGLINLQNGMLNLKTKELLP